MQKLKYFLPVAFFLLLTPMAFSQELSALLGGLVQSDNWVIRKDKAEEEFSGNVHYANDIYSINSDYALSKRKAQTYLLRGNVAASRNEDGALASIKAHEIFYNKKKDSGYAKAKLGQQVEGGYKTPNNNFKLFADRVEFTNKASFFKLKGAAELDDKNNTLYAENMSFDTITGVFEAEGQRPLLWGFSDNGDYALQADKITAQTKEGIFSSEGRVKGWLTIAQDLSKKKEEMENGTKIK